MRKFRLIKAYPMLDELGMIATLDEDRQVCTYINKNGQNCAVHFENVLKFPEFWEEIIDKDYEILAFSKNVDGVEHLFHLRKEGGYKHEDSSSIPLYSLDYLLALPHLHIHSVKRLSDGEIFTVGDKVSMVFIDKTIDLPITGINIEGDNLYLRGKEGTTSFSKCHIKYLEKAKEQPLFVTEDGYPVFRYNHLPLYNVYLWGFTIWVNDENSLYDPDLINFKYFTNKKAAENFIACHKPVLSFNDINKIAIEFGVVLPYTLKKELKNLAKSKL